MARWPQPREAAHDSDPGGVVAGHREKAGKQAMSACLPVTRTAVRGKGRLQPWRQGNPPQLVLSSRGTRCWSSTFWCSRSRLGPTLILVGPGAFLGTTTFLGTDAELTSAADRGSGHVCGHADQVLLASPWQPFW